MKKENLLRIGLYLLVALGVFLFVRVYCQYDYAYAEQMRLFRYSDVYNQATLAAPGGIFTWLADYLTQFYYLPLGGAVVNTVYFLLIVLLIDVALSCLKLSYIAPFVGVSTGLVVLVKETDVTYHTESTLKLILVLAVLAVILLVMDWLFLRKKSWWMPKEKMRTWLMVVGFLPALFIGFQFFKLNHFPQSTRLKVLESMRWKQDWDGILSLPYMQVCPAPLYACYQNLALAQKGLLGTKLNDYPQMGEEGLMAHNHGLQTEMMLLSDIYMMQGNVAEAQMHAFNSVIYSERLATPTSMLRLIETNLIMGQEKVAEKYIAILEETKFYAEKANSYRKFLGHPELVQSDPYLGPLQKITASLQGISGETLVDLNMIVDRNPDYQPAKDYLNAMQTLTLK